MNFNKILPPIAIIVLAIGGWRTMGWPGIALATGGVVMWILLHFTRLMTILKKAANRPEGSERPERPRDGDRGRRGPGHRR